MRWTGWLIAVIAVAGVCWRFPLFRVVSFEQAAKAKDAAVFDPRKFAETFWNGQLPHVLSKAVPAEVLLPTIQTNAAEAKRTFSRSVGVSESYTYFVSGKGRVLSVNEDEVLLAVAPGATYAEAVALDKLGSKRE